MRDRLKFLSVGEHTIATAFLGPRSVVVDLGAHKGGFSLALNQQFGCRCYLFEANAELFNLLPVDDSIRKVHCAVADHDGIASFHISNNPEGSSLLELPKESSVGSTLSRTEAVPARSLTSVLREMNLVQVDVLKVDIEGAEIAALGCLDATDLAGIKQLSVEFHSHVMFGFNLADDTSKLIHRLQAQGFVMIDFTRPHRKDVLFLNRRLLGLTRLQILSLELRYEFVPYVVRELRQRVALRTRLRRLLNGEVSS